MLTPILFIAMAQGQNARAATEADHALLLKTLNITSLRGGADGMNPNAPNAANTDESKANPYPNIPPLLTFASGKAVKSARDWSRRRAEIAELLDREIYGRTPKNLPRVQWTVDSETDTTVGGYETTTKKLIGKVDNRAYPAIEVNIRMTLVTPRRAKKVPVVMEFGFSFPQRPGAPTPPVPEWQSMVIKEGWAFAILEPGSFQADNGAGLRSGIIGLANKGEPRKPEDWGALKAWGWGASRALDYLERDPQTDAKRVVIEGLSRYGKAATVTMAYEPRFAIGFIGSSGQGGVKIWRRNSGEQVENVASSGEYHWMAGNYLKYSAEESSFGKKTGCDLTVDSHELIALCAPRLTFISYGIPEKGDSRWLDQKGSYLATIAAGAVFKLLGANDLGVSNDYTTEKMPPMLTDMLNGELAWRQHDGGHTDAPNFKYFIPWATKFLKYERKNAQ